MSAFVCLFPSIDQIEFQVPIGQTQQKLVASFSPCHVIADRAGEPCLVPGHVACVPTWLQVWPHQMPPRRTHAFERVMTWHPAPRYHKWHMGKKSKSRHKLALALKHGDGRPCWAWNLLDRGKECSGGRRMDSSLPEHKTELFQTTRAFGYGDKSNVAEPQSHLHDSFYSCALRVQTPCCASGG